MESADSLCRVFKLEAEKKRESIINDVCIDFNVCTGIEENWQASL